MSLRVTGKSPLDLYIINKVKEMRMRDGISQAVLAVKLGVSATFIGNIENPRHVSKYNLAHLNLLAKLFNCSPRDFLPEKPIWPLHRNRNAENITNIRSQMSAIIPAIKEARLPR